MDLMPFFMRCFLIDLPGAFAEEESAAEAK